MPDDTAFFGEPKPVTLSYPTFVPNRPAVPEITSKKSNEYLPLVFVP